MAQPYGEKGAHDTTANEAVVTSPAQEKKNAGKRKRTFWIVLLVVVALILLAVGLGAGLGIGLKKKHKYVIDSFRQIVKVLIKLW